MSDTAKKIKNYAKASVIMPFAVGIIYPMIAKPLAAMDTPPAMILPGIIVFILLLLSLFAGISAAVQWKKCNEKPVLIGGIAGSLISLGSLMIFMIGILIGIATLFLPEVQLEQFIAAAHKPCPIVVDDDVRCDSIVRGNDRDIEQYFTLYNITFEELDPNLFEDHMNTELNRLYREASEYKWPRINEVPMVFNYADKNGKFVCSIRTVL